MNSRNILTFDIETAAHMNIGQKGAASDINALRKGLGDLLGLLTTHKIKATFFMVGELVESIPDLIRQIAGAGHEVAFHSMQHKLVYQMTREEFEADIIRGKKLLEEISGQKIIG